MTRPDPRADEDGFGEAPSSDPPDDPNTIPPDSDLDADVENADLYLGDDEDEFDAE